MISVIGYAKDKIPQALCNTEGIPSNTDIVHCEKRRFCGIISVVFYAFTGGERHDGRSTESSSEAFC